MRFLLIPESSPRDTFIMAERDDRKVRRGREWVQGGTADANARMPMLHI